MQLVLPANWPAKSTLHLAFEQLDAGYGTLYSVAFLNVATTVLGAAPKSSLDASIALERADGSPYSASGVTIGSTLVAKVTITNAKDSSGSLSNITASPPLSVSPASALKMTTGPDRPPPSGGWTLAPGKSTSYKVTFTITSAGVATLAVHVTGVDGSGSGVSADASTKAHLGQPLIVTISWLRDGKPLTASVGGKNQPDTLRLADADAGEIADYVTARVVVKNQGKVAQQNVALSGRPSPSYATTKQSVRVLPISVISGPANAKIGNLAPGQSSKPIDFDLRVANNGTFNVSQLVLSSSPGANSTNVSEGKSLLTALPTKLLWLSLHSLSSGTVAPGTPVLIGGTVTNRSLTQSLDLNPLIANITGHAGGGDLVDQTALPQPDGVELPFAGTLDPGQTIDVIAEVGTELVPGTRAEVSYQPTGTVEWPNGSTSDLTSGDVGMKDGSSPIHISLNVADPPPPPSSLETIANNFADATFFYTAKFSYEAFSGVGDFMAHPVDATSAAVGGVSAVTVAAGHTLVDTAALVASINLLATVGQSLTPAERQKWSDQIVADFKASHLKIAADKATAIYQKVNDAAYNTFVPFENAVQTGNYNKVAELAGEGFGAGLTSTGDLLVSDIIFQKFVIGLGQLPSALHSVAVTGKDAVSAAGNAVADATGIRTALKSQFADDVTLASELKNAGVTQSLGKGLAGIEKGQNLLLNGAAALTDIYGLTRSQIKALQAFCETNDIIIAVRSRSKKAAQLIRDGLAVGKNEIIKIKNVSEIDTAYLGYSSADLNTIVWAEPVPIEYVLAKLRSSGADAVTRDVVLQRFYLRESEWVNPKINAILNKAEKAKTIAWTLDGSGNGASTLIEQTRSFGLKPQPNPVSDSVMGTRKYEQVLVGNKPLDAAGKRVAGTRLVPITQDVDMMAILTAQGDIVAANLRAKYYEYLSNLIGIEHGETPSWILNGEIIFQAKAKILADAIPGGEALAVFGPNGSVNAGFYNAALSVFNNVTKSGRIYFDGGYNNPYFLWKAKVLSGISTFANGL